MNPFGEYNLSNIELIYRVVFAPSARSKAGNNIPNELDLTSPDPDNFYVLGVKGYSD